VVAKAVQADAADAPTLPQRDARGLERQPNPSGGGNDIAHHTTVLARTRTRRGWEDHVMAIEVLDVLYLPSRDVKADLTFYRDILGGRVIFAIEAMGTRVAEIALAPQGPRVVLADHLPGDAPILLHRVSDLDQTLAELGARGLQLEARAQLPLGPCATFRSPGGQRLGLYQLTRPEVDEHFAGRTDFG
jgi:hypothetical protein